ncbi:hypothetical protein MY9_4003 [Bacillus sp. JS]|nr:hypothetical protein MY9_4003 [Bacillus sp. JS]
MIFQLLDLFALHKGMKMLIIYEETINKRLNFLKMDVDRF